MDVDFDSMSTISSNWSEAEISVSIFCSSSGGDICDSDLSSQADTYSWASSQNEDTEVITPPSTGISPASDVSLSASYESLGFGTNSSNTSVSNVTGGNPQREMQAVYREPRGSTLSMRDSGVSEWVPRQLANFGVVPNYGSFHPSLLSLRHTSARESYTAVLNNIRPRKLGEPISKGILNQRTDPTDAFIPSSKRHRRQGEVISPLNQRAEQAYASTSKGGTFRQKRDLVGSLQSLGQFDMKETTLTRRRTTSVGIGMNYSSGFQDSTTTDCHYQEHTPVPKGSAKTVCHDLEHPPVPNDSVITACLKPLGYPVPSGSGTSYHPDPDVTPWSIDSGTAACLDPNKTTLSMYNGSANTDRSALLHSPISSANSQATDEVDDDVLSLASVSDDTAYSDQIRCLNPVYTHIPDVSLHFASNPESDSETGSNMGTDTHKETHPQTDNHSVLGDDVIAAVHIIDRESMEERYAIYDMIFKICRLTFM